MNEYLITPLFVLLIAGGIVGIATFLFLYRYRKVPGVKYWLIWQITVPVWAFSYAFEFAATSLDTKIFWSKLSYLGIVYSAISFLFFSLEFAGRKRFLSRRMIGVGYFLATLFLIPPFTNNLHHLHWKSYSIDAVTNATEYVYGPLFWLFFLFSYLALFAGIINIGLLYLRMPAHYKRQIGLLFLSAIIPPVGNLIYVFRINPVPGFDWTPFTFLLTGVLIAINISEFRMFDLVPFARNKLIDIIPDAILVLDRNTRIADYNPAMRKLITPDHEELIGKTAIEVFPEAGDLLNELMESDDFHKVIVRERNGEVQHFDLYANALSDQGGTESGRLIVLRNITRYVMAEEKIRQTNLQLKEEIGEKEKLIADLDAFSHTVAHDLKNMLGVIVSASGLIRSGIEEGMGQEELFEINDMVSESATRTIHITRELLTLASVRQQEIRPVAVDMQRVVAEAVSRLKSMADEYNATIKLPGDWPVVLGYEAWLEEVWVNYLSNAMKYGGYPPVIEIGYSRLPDNQLKYWIADNGKGLTPEQIDLLFHKFTRLETLRVEGHGLGLSIVRRIIEKLGGRVGVESPNIAGNGSTFYFILPLAPEP